MREAAFYRKLENGVAECFLCPRHCRIAPGSAGFCRVRRNEGGTLYALTFNHPAAMANDPVEKKPLRHFLPGSFTFSVGTFGCNLGCVFCQNDSLSRSGVPEGMEEIPASRIVEAALRYRSQSVALTYNEPTVFIEYGMEIARAAHDAGLKVILVTNGYISREAREAFYPLADAANIDVKGFGDFYPVMCKGELAPVLESCEYFRNVLGKHLEITNLVIPGRNDSPGRIDALLDWAGEKFGKEIPLHFSAFFPAGGYAGSPRTPRETLFAIRAHAAERGFERIHLGNI